MRTLQEIDAELKKYAERLNDNPPRVIRKKIDALLDERLANETKHESQEVLHINPDI